jgi:hypothetical protein
MSESIELTEARLREVADLEAIGARVAEVTRASLQDPLERVRFLARYTSWNAFFGAGVATLAGKVARSRGVFLDPAEPVRAVADRSVLVGSYFFDAARDEFDDGGTAHRDTHRCLAQALIRGVLDWEQAHGAPAARAQLADLDFVNRWLADPLWLVGLNHQVAVGYGGGAAEDVVGLFRPMGYHLGSELLADEEFSVIDATLQAAAPALVAHLRSTKVEIAGQRHTPYQWVRTHSGHGASVEAEHFEWAIRGVRVALGFVDPALRPALVDQVLRGFADFVDDHDEFFRSVRAD